MSDTVQRALVARIEQLESQNSALVDQTKEQRQRISNLETVLNNVWSALPKTVQDNYQGWRQS